MPEVLKRPVKRVGRPETRPKREIELIEFFGTEDDEIRLRIRWDIRPVHAGDVSALFGGLESILNRAMRAFLSTEEDGRRILEVVDPSESLIEIEIEELSLGSLKAIVKLIEKIDIRERARKGGKALADHLKDLAIHEVLKEAIKKSAHWAVFAVAYFGFGFDNPKHDTGLSDVVVKQELKHAEDVLRDLGKYDFPSKLSIEENVTRTRASVDLPLSPGK